MFGVMEAPPVLPCRRAIGSEAPKCLSKSKRKLNLALNLQATPSAVMVIDFTSCSSWLTTPTAFLFLSECLNK
jgi:hypothetical protein